MKLTLSLFALAALLPLSLSAQSTPPPAPQPVKSKKAVPNLPDTIALFEKVESSKPEGLPVLLNIYVPKAAGNYPAILMIHGGGWQKRQVEADKPLAERLAARGYVVAQVAYRLSTDAKYPAALHDCKAALRYLRAHAAEYKIDPTRIGCTGGSAGGHLSGLVGLTGGVKALEGSDGNADQSTAIKACVVMASTMDLVAANKDKNSESAVLFFGPFAEKKDTYTEASPITYAGKTSPPTLFIEGEKDTLKIGRAEMQDKLRSAGVPTELITLKDAPHPFWMSHPWLEETVKATGDWFDKYLK
ncbi:MAG TPA: alpha/beta hydrolase [Verrucomicrobium sp.]|nr:alpha/beta hydrolase [Verrucomicrobium sp.]